MKTHELITQLKQQGCYFVGHCGSHDRYETPEGVPLFIPRHKGEVATGLAQSLLKKCKTKNERA